MRGPLGDRRPQSRDQLVGVDRRRPLLVVVEVGVDLPALPVPREDVLGPVSERGVVVVPAIAPGRSVPTHVDVAGGRDPRRRRGYVVGNAECDVLLAQEIEDAVLVPPAIAEFERVAVPLVEPLQEGRQPLAVGLHLRRQLEQHRPELLTEQLQPRFHELDAVVVDVLQPLDVGEEARRFPGEHEALRRLLHPSLDRLHRRHAVEHPVQLNGGEVAAVEAEVLLLRQFAREEAAVPMAIKPSRCADQHLLTCAAWQASGHAR